MSVNLPGLAFHGSRCGSSAADVYEQTDTMNEKIPNSSFRTVEAAFPKSLFLNSALPVLFIKKWIPMEEATQACIPSCPLTSVMGCINPTLLRSLVCFFSPRSLSLTVLKLNLSYSEGKIRRSGVSGESFLAC